MTRLWRGPRTAKTADKNADEELKFGIVGRIRRDAGLRRKIVRVAVLALVGIAVSATAATALLLWLSSANLADRAAEIGDIFAGTTLLLTVVAALVAYLAYAVSTGMPHLKLQVCFGSSLPNQPMVTAECKNGQLEAKNSGPTVVTVRFRNDGIYTAKDPAVIVRLEGMAFTADVPSLNAAGWIVNDSGETGVTAVQWDGGPAYSVHGGLVRELPVLSLDGLRTVLGSTGSSRSARSVRRRWLRSHAAPHEPSTVPFIVVYVLTSASRTLFWMPVDFKVNGKSRFPPEKKLLPEWFGA